MKKSICAISVTLFVLFAAGAANADLITQNFKGEITFAAENNMFGVAANDTISWSTTYDPGGAYTNETHYVFINSNEDYKLNVTIGNRTFVETEDYFYNDTSLGGPYLMLSKIDDTITGMSFTIIDTVNHYSFRSINKGAGFKINLHDENGNDQAEAYVTGTFSFDPVPVPSAILLFGAGLASLAGLCRKNS